MPGGAIRSWCLGRCSYERSWLLRAVAVSAVLRGVFFIAFWYPKILTWWGWQRHIAMRRPSISSTFPSRSWSCSSSHLTCLDSNEDMKMLRWNKSGQAVDIINLSELTTCTGCWILFHPNHPNWWIFFHQEWAEHKAGGARSCSLFVFLRSAELMGTFSRWNQWEQLPRSWFSNVSDDFWSTKCHPKVNVNSIRVYVCNCICIYIYIYFTSHTI